MIDVQSIIGNKYQLLEKLAAGGGGVVWRAKQTTPLLCKEGKGEVDQEDIALKILSIDPSKSKEILAERFKREFELFKKVSHPNIAKIYDFGFDEENEIYFFTSELLLGGDLKKLVRAPIPVIENLLLQALRALEYLRNFGILHLDIKPQNLLLRTNPPTPPLQKGGEGGFKPTLALIDFGLATFHPPDRPGGTPNYMPPEVVVRRLGYPSPSTAEGRGDGDIFPPPDHRSDLYSLGVTFYYILSGVQPFEAYKEGKPDNNAIMLAHLKEKPPPPPSFHNRSVPQYLDAIIMRMMEPNPDDRYQAAILAAQALCFRSPNRLEVESKETISAYLPEEGLLIGRHEEMGVLEKIISDVANPPQPPFEKGGRGGILCIAGGWGVGKTRLLKSIKPFAQQQEMDVFTDLMYERLNFKGPMAFLIDDPFLSASDASSISNVFALKHLIQQISQLPKARCFVAFTLNTDLIKVEDALKVLEIERSLLKVITLKNFTLEEISEYLTHLLGESPSQEIVDELNSLTFGNPKFIADVVRRVMEKGELFSYLSGRAGAKALAALGFSFVHAESPPSLSEHLLGLVGQLPRGAKILAHRLACWQRPVGVDEIFLTTPSPLAGEGQGEGDLAALLSSCLVKRNEEGMFSFTNPLSSKIIEAHLDPKERASIHDEIAITYSSSESRAKSRDESRSDFELSRHLAFGSDPKLQREAALKLAVEAPKRLHPAESAELLSAVEEIITTQVSPDQVGQASRLSAKQSPDILEVRSQLLVSIGQSLMRLGRWDDAKATIERLRTLAQPIPSPLAGEGRGEGDVLRITNHESRVTKLNLRADEQLGLIALRQRKLSEAREMFTKALSALASHRELRVTPSPLPALSEVERMGEGGLPADALVAGGEGAPSFTVQSIRLENYLAGVDLREGKYESAAETYKCTADSVAKLPDAYRVQIMNNELGETLILLGKPREAVEVLERELQWAKKADHRECIVNCIRLLGDAQRNLKNYDEAIAHYQNALEFSLNNNLFEHQLGIRNSYANMLLQMGRFSEAIEQYKPALDLAMQLEGKATAVDIMVNLGLTCNKLNQFDDAIEYLELALDFAKGPEAESSVKIRDIIPLIHLRLGNAHYNKGELNEAEKHLSTILKNGDEQKLSDITLYNLYGTLCEIDLARHNITRAKEHLKILKEIAAKVPEAADHFKKLMDQIGGFD